MGIPVSRNRTVGNNINPKEEVHRSKEASESPEGAILSGQVLREVKFVFRNLSILIVTRKMFHKNSKYFRLLGAN